MSGNGATIFEYFDCLLVGLTATPKGEVDRDTYRLPYPCWRLFVGSYGRYGSFALTESNEQIWKSAAPVDWSWFSNLPHHVTVTL
jgi:hypothetical protein